MGLGILVHPHNALVCVCVRQVLQCLEFLYFVDRRSAAHVSSSVSQLAINSETLSFELR